MAQIRLLGLEVDMHMIDHHTVGTDAHSEGLGEVSELSQEECAIQFFGKNGEAEVTPLHDMVAGTGKLDAKRSGHGTSGQKSRRAVRGRMVGLIVTLLSC